MIYGGIPLHYLWQSLVIILGKNHQVRHFEDSDLNDSVPLGRTATIIYCTLQAFSFAEYVTLMQIAHREASADLQIGQIYFKNVTSGERSPIKTVTKNFWTCEIEFRAADPTPYSIATDEPLY